MWARGRLLLCASLAGLLFVAGYLFLHRKPGPRDHSSKKQLVEYAEAYNALGEVLAMKGEIPRAAGS